MLDAGHPAWLARLLVRRGVDSPAAAEAFLDPSIDGLLDARDLDGLQEAVERLLDVRTRGGTVVVVGDYDVDGVTGTALLVAVLRARGVAAEAILPRRLESGYGFQPCHVDEARGHGADLLVTVDCGTTGRAAAEAAIACGLDVIVTDHHLPGGELPAEVIEINPKREACGYGFDELSGAGLAFKLALAFAEATGEPIAAERLLAIAALGTIADLVPLRGENRVIASLGLEALESTRSRGLRALLGVARLEPPYTANDIGFRVGPRLNAPGRVGAADAALELLLTRDEARAQRLASDLDARNRERQTWERQAAAEAEERFATLDPLPPILVGWSADWHRGVVGIAAGRLARRFHRPTLLLAVDGDTASGSGRSLDGIHLHEFVSRFADRLERFGGHAQAIGLSARTEDLESLRHDMIEAAQEWRDRVAQRTYEYELDLAVGDAVAVAQRLDRLEPFGKGNPRPLVRLRGPLEALRSPRPFGRGHLEIEAGDAHGRIPLVGWNWAERRELFERPFEALGHLEFDRYRSTHTLRLTDARPAASPSAASPSSGSGSADEPSRRDATP